VNTADSAEGHDDARSSLRDLPGGAKAALEAVLMVVDQPATEDELAAGLN